MTVDGAILGALEWRCLGPYRGGRSVAVAGDPTNRMRFYFGACNGGVWKTENGGAHWENVSDGYFRTAAVGAIAVADSDPNVLYAGMGEACVRNDASSGDGMYRSTDRGATWQHVGLDDTRHIGRLRVDPHDPDVVYVAALGHAWAPNEQRGVFRSRDGGDTWDRVLYRDEKTGAIDVSMDPTNPRILYAALWEMFRAPWTISSGGPGSGLFKSTDGGDTWTELTDNPGLPKGLKGRIGVEVSPARPERVWAMVEAKGDAGGLYRSEDGGATWRQVNNSEGRMRPWYYSHLAADPQDAETVWVMDGQLWRSHDGGRTLHEVPSPHADHHQLWIDPADPLRMINASDGGASISFTGGDSWSSLYNQPTAPIHRMTTDSQYPFRVYGTQQDNTAINLPSRTGRSCIAYADCEETGLAESGDIAVRPDDVDVVYAGAVGSGAGAGADLIRYDRSIGGRIEYINVWPEGAEGWAPKDEKYRYPWTYPVVLSPHDPNVLYVALNHVFRSTTEGKSWEEVSPDLTRNDPEKMQVSGGPIAAQGAAGADTYCTISAFAESPVEPGLLWAGSDDGLVHVSRNAGGSWEQVTPPDLPEWTTVASIEPSHHDPATAYLAAFRYKLDDYRPYVYRTRDLGRTWDAIGGGIPETDFTRVIREDPLRPGLLYVGTETGLHISVDDGGSWLRVPCDPERMPGRSLPVVPIYDMAVEDEELVVATHGRSFWILDDVAVLRQLPLDAGSAPAHLFAPRRIHDDQISGHPHLLVQQMLVPHVRNWDGANGHMLTLEERPDGSTYRRYLDAGDDGPDGVAVHYWLAEPPQSEVALTFADRDGQEIVTFTGATDGAAGSGRRVPAEPGMNTFYWDVRYPGATPIAGDPTAAFAGRALRTQSGHRVPPGTYQVRLTVDGTKYTRELEIAPDPRLTCSADEYAAKDRLLLAIRDRLSQVNQAISTIRVVRHQSSEWARRSGDAGPVLDAVRRLEDELSGIEGELIQTQARTPAESSGYPVKLNTKLRTLNNVVLTAIGRPTEQSVQVFDELSAEVQRQLDRLATALRDLVPALEEAVAEAKVPLVVVGEPPDAES